MDIADIKRIEELAIKMRLAIESLSSEFLEPSMASFPNGACGDSAHLLAAYFADNGYQKFNYICAERGNHTNNTWTTHAWLACEKLFVDITADQFSDSPCGIIVSSNSVWHQKFKITDRYENADFRCWSGLGTAHLHRIYSVLKPLLNSG